MRPTTTFLEYTYSELVFWEALEVNEGIKINEKHINNITYANDAVK